VGRERLHFGVQGGGCRLGNSGYFYSKGEGRLVSTRVGQEQTARIKVRVWWEFPRERWSIARQPTCLFVCHKERKPSTKLGIVKRLALSNLTKFSSSLEQEKRLVCPADFAAVEDVLQSEVELLDSANKRVSLLGEARRKEGDQIIGLRYSMNDRKSTAKESEESVKAIECALLLIEAEISCLTQVVSAVLTSSNQFYGVLRDFIAFLLFQVCCHLCRL